VYALIMMLIMATFEHPLTSANRVQRAAWTLSEPTSTGEDAIVGVHDGPQDGPSISAKFVVVGPTAVGTGAIPRTGSGSGSNSGFLAPNQRTRALPFAGTPGGALGAALVPGLIYRLSVPLLMPVRARAYRPQLEVMLTQHTTRTNTHNGVLKRPPPETP
jgi:hypothetical protein